MNMPRTLLAKDHPDDEARTLLALRYGEVHNRFDIACARQEALRHEARLRLPPMLVRQMREAEERCGEWEPRADSRPFLGGDHLTLAWPQSGSGSQAEDEVQTLRRQLRELSAFLQQAREEERTHIARELHDELGQMLTGLRMDVEWLQRQLSGADDRIAAKIAAMTGLIDNTLHTVRRISADLRPAVLDDLGLEEAIDWLVESFRSRTGTACQLRLDLGDAPLEEPLATAVFRLVQESLTNVTRHAQAGQVEIALTADQEVLKVMVRDNGIGFDTDSRRPRSFGLLGMRERVVALNGYFGINSRPGIGTTISAVIPWQQTGSDAQVVALA
jgi:two-component system sensor histidine kinase UhpB